MKNGNHFSAKSGPVKNSLSFLILAALSVFFLLSCVTSNGVFQSNITVQRYPGDGNWLRGDLHMHSLYSDGDSSIQAVIEASRSSDLDFIAVTDHDTSQKGIISSWKDPGYEDPAMMMLYGTEWTTSMGHANIISAVPFDYSVLWEANRKKDFFLALKAAQTAGAIFSMNHPVRITPSWKYPAADLRVMEIWNAPFRFPTGNRQAVGMIWTELLLSGRRVTGIGGSDSHRHKGMQSRINPPGYPTTWIYAEEKSPQAIIDAIKAGKVSVSYAPYGPRLELTADRVQIKAQAVFHETPDWAPGFFRIILYGDDTVIASEKLRAANGFSVVVNAAPSNYTYFRAELHGPPEGNLLFRYLTGNTLAVANPIYTRQ
ncbi:MAG: CehA/McbA family metallohydrolase [Spirochaetia bacterium]